MYWKKLLLLISLVALTAASCGRGQSTTAVTTISEATIATGIEFQNQPSNQVTSVAAGTPSIYMSAKVSNPVRGTMIRVRWLKLPSSIIGTEDFNGSRSGQSRFDYNPTAQSSYFASQVDRPGSSWPLGDYVAEIFLNGRLNQTIGFKVVTDADAEQEAAANKVRRLVFGDRVDAENRLLNVVSTFETTTPNIYASADLNQITIGSELEIAVRYVRDNVSVGSFKTQYESGTNLTIEIDSNQLFRRSRSDRNWPEGSYEVTILVDGVRARTANFIVQ